MLAVGWPSGALRGSPTSAARKLATLKQCAPFLRSRLHCSAMPQAQGISIVFCFVEKNTYLPSSLKLNFNSFLYPTPAVWLLGRTPSRDSASQDIVWAQKDT